MRFAIPGRVARMSALALVGLATPLLISTTAEAAGPLGPCNATQVGSTITLTSNCTTSATITAADGVTVDGDGYSITAVDPISGNFSGPVLKSATGTPTIPAVLNVRNLNVVASLAAHPATSSLSGLYYENAGGSITNVSLSGLTAESGGGAGRALEVRNAAATTAPALSINGLKVRNYGKSGVFIQGKTTFTATNLDIGPATGVDGSQWLAGASNGFTVFGGAGGGPSGSLTNSKIAGNRYATDDAHNDVNVPEGVALAILAIDSPSFTISNVTVTGVDSDQGLIVQDFDSSATSKTTVTCSSFSRTAGGHADPLYGQAITNDATDGSITVVAGSNTFSGWAHNTEGPITSTVDPACTPSAKATVTAKAKKDEVKAGKKIKITGTASPALAGVTVSLQVKKNGEFKTVSTATLTASGAFKFGTKAKRAFQHHNMKLRVVVGTGTFYAGGTSGVVKVHVV
jgi:hypothetical protein